MKTLKHLMIIVLAVIGLHACKLGTKKHHKHSPYLIVLSMDGFRYDYSDSVNTPHLDEIAKMGVRADAMQTSFPSKTFPNHYTLATGLTPNHHGIVNNNFYAPDLEMNYSPQRRSAVQDGRFYLGEPIWNTAMKQGLKTASYFWIGSEANIQGMHPNYWKVYDGKVDFKHRIDTVIHWLNLPITDRPNLIMWYVHEPDNIGHAYGPHSSQTDSVVAAMDNLLAYFMQQLKQQPMADSVNIIITSDHGMANISAENCVALDQYVKDEWLLHIKGGNPIYNLAVAPNCKDSIMAALSQAEGVLCYDNSLVSTQDYLQYGSNPRCLDLTVLADIGYSIKACSLPKLSSKGTHGYHPKHQEMDAIFYAYGPSFKKAYQQPRFRNTAVYELMCHLLSIKPAPNNGDFESVKGMLKDNN